MSALVSPKLCPWWEHQLLSHPYSSVSSTCMAFVSPGCLCHLRPCILPQKPSTHSESVSCAAGVLCIELTVHDLEKWNRHEIGGRVGVTCVLCLGLINNRLFSESQIDRVPMNLHTHRIHFKAQYLSWRKINSNSKATVPVYLDTSPPQILSVRHLRVRATPPCWDGVQLVAVLRVCSRDFPQWTPLNH